MSGNTPLSTIYFEVDSAVGGWQWRIRGRNHEIMSSSEILTRRETAIAGIREVKDTGSRAPVWDRGRLLPCRMGSSCDQ